jgi:DNA polymerase-2
MENDTTLTIECFLLTTSSRDNNGHFEILLYAKSADNRDIKIIITRHRPLFFIPRQAGIPGTNRIDERKNLSLTSLKGDPVDCLYFTTYRDRQQCARTLASAGIILYESDIHPVKRFLMERMVKGGISVEGTCREQNGLLVFIDPEIKGADVTPALATLSLDIETNAYTGEILSIACYSKSAVVFMQGSDLSTELIRYCDSERSLLETFLNHLKEDNPDIVIGWNVINFDLNHIQKRCRELNLPFEMGKDQGSSIYLQKGKSNQYNADLPGRVVLDGPTVLRSNNYRFDRYTLDNVASELLGKSKDITNEGKAKIDEIIHDFENNKQKLAEYNIHDTILTREIFDKTDVTANAIEKSRQSGHLIDQFGGSIAAFDYLYLPQLHRKGYVAPDVPANLPYRPLKGGEVLDSIPGIYENVLLLDFKSLYPTIIKTFNIDPLTRVLADDDSITGPTDIPFARSKAILPTIITRLLAARAQAKKDNNSSLSYGIKILMNSFYGVLGSISCRFFSAELAEAITGTGRFILKKTCSYIEQTTGYTVVYGDTDSLFLLLGPGKEKQAVSIGNEIVSATNEWLTGYIQDSWQADSILELEMETHYRHFFMPTIRGSMEGSKKRYCGMVQTGHEEFKLQFKGMESARTDWTELARDFQQALYLKVFLKEEVSGYIRQTVQSVLDGSLDQKLVFKKHLRKPIHEYVKNVPPHAQAAKLLKDPGRSIHYYITVDGPQPVQKVTSTLDYRHYIETQLKPIANSILEWINLDFDDIVSGQGDLFSGM